MYWHIESDIISLLVMAAILLYSLQSSAGAERDRQTRRFLWCLLVGCVVTAVDIAASVIMEVPVSAFVYHLMMTLDFVGLELTIVVWIQYCIVVLYHSDRKGAARATNIVWAAYAVYALFALSNPWTGLMYSLGPDNEYSRGPLFFLMTAVYVAFTLALLILTLLRRRRMPAAYPGHILMITPGVLAVAIAAQLLNPGWLTILPGYMLSLVLAFLFLQTRQIKERETAEQMRAIMDNVTGGLCASVQDQDGRIRTLMANENYYAMFGYTKEQFERERRDPLQAVAPEDRARVAEILSRVIRERGDAAYDFEAVKRDGSLFTVHCQNSVTRVPGMGDTVLLGMLTDITELKDAEEAARVHEEEMRLAMAQLGKMICEYNFDTGKLTVPEAYADRFDASLEYMDLENNEQRRDTIDPESWDDYQNFHRSILRGDETGQLEMRTKWADGSSHWERGEFYSIFDSAGKPVKTVIAVEDTTEQHRRYELEQSRPSLGEENLLIHALFDLSTGETLDYSYRDGREVPPEERIAFQPDGEILKRIIINRRERELYGELKDREALLARFESGETELSIDYRRRLNQDDIIWVRNILRMVREPGGSDILLFEYCYSIETEKTRELMYGALVNENFDFVGRVNAKNRHYSLITRGGAHGAMPPVEGEDMDQMIRDIAARYTHPDDREAMLAEINVENIVSQLRDKEHFQFSSRLIPEDGRVYYKTLNMYYLDREREIIIITREDVSGAMEEELRKNQALSEALAAAEQGSRAKSRFLSRMSHELRTPMNVILGTTTLAFMDQETPREMEEACQAISASARYQLSIIDDILEISRIESGKITLTESPFRLRSLLDDISEIISDQAAAKGLVYEAKLSGVSSDSFIGDKMKLQQVFVYLLNNAVKFTPKGGRVSLELSQGETTDRDALLRFTVRDNGIGIGEEFMEHIYEPFSQEIADNTASAAGTGLGLAIVKSLVELMDGEISASSVKGEGSEFTVSLRLRLSAENAGAGRKAPSRLPDLSGRRLMVVEDNAMNALILERLLARVGAEVQKAVNGLEAVDSFRDHPEDYYDAILMDIRMPVMDGLAATRSIRALDKADSASVPIIAVSANAFDEDVELSLQSGMNAHLSKPIDISELGRALTQAFAARNR